ELNKREFNQSDWERAIGDIDYSKDLEKDQPKKKKESKERRDISFNPGFSKSFATVLLVIIGVALLVLLLRLTLGAQAKARNKKIKANQEVTSLEEIEENLTANDPTSLIEQAIQSGNYRLALRLYYLKIIRELSLTGAIEWKKDKTNGEYLRELKVNQLRSPFRSVTIAFERIWYGNRAIDQEEFMRLQPEFDQLLNTIPKNEQ
ncbi:MAG: DUF4129 domain-containing protein, partial [Bacteroidota bacterium]